MVVSVNDVDIRIEFLESCVLFVYFFFLGLSQLNFPWGSNSQRVGFLLCRGVVFFIDKIDAYILEIFVTSQILPYKQSFC
jgi:hypothetical protein